MRSVFQCRSCFSGRGGVFLDLGIQPLANNLLREDDLGKEEPKFPLRLAVCESCWLLQIMDIIPPVQLFSEYLYFSSFSDALLRHSQAAVDRHIREFGLDDKSFVVEIASNDGYLLKNFVAARVPCLGIEPAANIARVAREKGIETIEEFFGESTARKLAEAGRRADLILGNNVFAHAPDTNDFVKGLHALLKPNGRVVLEFPYAVDLIEHNEFDTIYHEHVFYFTVIALVPLFTRNKLAIVQVEHLPIHGGSLRVTVAHEGAHKPSAAVGEFLENEKRLGISSVSYYEGFGAKVMALKEKLNGLVASLKKEGKSVAAYGASAKGSTLLNFFGLGRAELDFVVDRSTYKQGRLTPGTHLPILPVEELVRRQPSHTLLLTWNFAEEILKQQEEYRRRGGKFIIPIPDLKIV